jgi:hypothetical protein
MKCLQFLLVNFSISIYNHAIPVKTFSEFYISRGRLLVNNPQQEGSVPLGETRCQRWIFGWLRQCCGWD